MACGKAEYAVPSRKYQFMEANTQRRSQGLKEKIPEIQKTLDTVQFLKTQKVGSSPMFGFFWVCPERVSLFQPDSEPVEATFELNDTLYAKALVPPTEEVYLWLGANVMLSYPIVEAETLLESKLAVAQENQANCEEDLDFLREQITVTYICGVFCVFEYADTAFRRWRWRRQGFITGTSCRNGKKRRNREKMRMRRR